MSSSKEPPDAEAVEDDNRQYGHGPLTAEELVQNYPNRPHNHSKTLPFHELFTSLFNPLNDNKKRPTGPTVARAKQGPHGPNNLSPHEVRRNVIQRFISRWRSEVGDEFYPALRLIIPEKDRDRAMYGLKEKAIGKLLVKLLKISPNSVDGFNLINWKLPGETVASRMAGDFAGRCYEVLSKRTMRESVGDMRIAEVNELLDRLSAAQKEEQQLPIFETFYERMNADELMWLIRIILRQMKVGATEKTFLDLWHPDGEALFNVSSSLRRVCWELKDPSIRLEGDEAGITLMQCFQPQLAQFQMHSFQKMVDNMRPTEDDTEFWIEEKLDGERMQMHMIEDEKASGGRRFAFWSRKAKEYTYLYGSSFEDDNSALTRHIKEAFDLRVKNIILDGEMITWDPEADIMVPFGTLKTAAISEQRNPFQGTGIRPLYRVFDCLYLNDEDITKFTLRDRRNALEGAIKNVHRRIEVHQYEKAHSAAAIEPLLRKVVAEASEGLVLKNPRSMYRLNSRNDDWMKVKPEYMTEFGEFLDCVVVGGYYGSGHRGGRLSSFLCGLRVDQNHIDKGKYTNSIVVASILIRAGANPMKCFSFFKVGGGFKADDYANIRHHTDGKWVEWDRNHPPTEFIELGGGDLQYEKPDVWIKPCDSVLLEVKAASVGASDQFRMGFTLRFPRFKKLRLDKDWTNALSIQEFIELKIRVEKESKEKEFKIDTGRKMTKRLKKEIVIAGNEEGPRAPYAGSKTKIFEGLNFCVLSEMLHPQKKSKAEIEQVIKGNGGLIFQSPTAKDDMIVLGDKRVVKVASLMKSETTNILKPSWVLDVLRQADADGEGRQRFLIPFEPGHMFYTKPDAREQINGNIDEYGDSYARDVSVDDLQRIFNGMESPRDFSFSPITLLSELETRGKGLGEMRGSLFGRCVVCFVPVESRRLEQDPQLSVRLEVVTNQFLFAGGVVACYDDKRTTHVVVGEQSAAMVKSLRAKIVALGRSRLPRIVKWEWVQASWREGTLLDEERYAVVA